jgi:hypothetical protein
MRGRVVEAGDVAQRFCIAISSSVSRQSTAKPGHTTSTRRTPRAAIACSVASVAGSSQRSLPKRDW